VKRTLPGYYRQQRVNLKRIPALLRTLKAEVRRFEATCRESVLSTCPSFIMQKARKGFRHLEVHFVLYRDGEALYTSPEAAVDLSGVSDFQRIPIRKRLQLENTLQPGDYILQLVVTDKQANKKNNGATQVLQFEILGKQESN
jgi:hypothetical protein